ncbi:hypothetical protein THAOC_33665, partial [Thalassiosira oceanica]
TDSPLRTGPQVFRSGPQSDRSWTATGPQGLRSGPQISEIRNHPVSSSVVVLCVVVIGCVVVHACYIFAYELLISQAIPSQEDVCGRRGSDRWGGGPQKMTTSEEIAAADERIYVGGLDPSRGLTVELVASRLCSVKGQGNLQHEAEDCRRGRRRQPKLLLPPGESVVGLEIEPQRERARTTGQAIQ